MCGDCDERFHGHPTNLEAVLIGFENGVDLRRREDVAAEH